METIARRRYGFAWLAVVTGILGLFVVTWVVALADVTTARQPPAKQGHRLWVANWNVKKPVVPALDWAGRGWSIWQYTSSGSVTGIPGRVDLNQLASRLAVSSITYRPTSTPPPVRS